MEFYINFVALRGAMLIKKNDSLLKTLKQENLMEFLYQIREILTHFLKFWFQFRKFRFKFMNF